MISITPIVSPDGKAVKAFASHALFEEWMGKQDVSHEGIWVRFFKKNSGVDSVTYAQALDIALCYGWIDGPVRSADNLSWIHKFTPRGRRSVWSQINKGHIARLTQEGRMKPQGIVQVDAAKADGRWDDAYASPSTFEMPKYFMVELNQSPKAYDFYVTLPNSDRYHIYYQLHSAKKQSTRETRVAKFLAMLERGEKPR
jgi:uncharacterized protein YdeI (YjbR/CyaY-like superfamily)